MAPRHGGEDWRRSLRSASFRGAHFWVDMEGVDGGRRVVVHEFPHSEIPFNEDMGQQVRRYEVAAYCAGGAASAQAKAFFEACTAIGPATLVLPMSGTVFAKCVDVSLDRSKDRHGFVGFRARFVGEGLQLGGMGGAPHYKSRIKSSSANAALIARRSFNNSYRGVGVARFVVDSAVATTSAFVGQWMTAISQSGLRGADAAKINKLLADFDADLPDLLECGYVGNKYSADAFWTSEVSISADPFTEPVFAISKKYRETATANTAVSGYRTLLDFGETLLEVPLTTLNRKQEATNQESLLALFRRSALVELAIAVTEKTYPSRRDAVDMRAFIAQRFDDELRVVREGEKWEVLGALLDLRGQTIEYLSSLIADLAPVLQIEAKSMLPAQYWAYRLYGDATRGDEITQRNQTKHPSWMPAIFEALSR